jgi:titin
VAVQVGGSSTTAVVPGLRNGTQYTFTVTAANVIGTGQTSAPSAEVMPVARPSAPTSVVAVPADRTAHVSWSAADGNGDAVNDYTVTSSPDGATCTTATTQCSVTGLTNGRTYTFTVVAANDVGPGPASGASAGCDAAGLPTAPTAVVAVPATGRRR